MSSNLQKRKIMSLAKLLSKPNVREVSVELTIEGEKVPVTVRYKSTSVKDSRAQREMIKRKEDAEETVYYSDMLASKIESIVEADGTIIKVDFDLLENIAVENLKAIFDAVNGNTDPKSETQN